MGHNIPNAWKDLLCSTKYHLVPDQDFYNNYGHQDRIMDNSLEFLCVRVFIVINLHCSFADFLHSFFCFLGLIPCFVGLVLSFGRPWDGVW